MKNEMLARIQLILAWKRKIVKLNITKAKCKCPYCKGMWHGVIVGKKKHLHMKCDGDCNTAFME